MWVSFLPKRRPEADWAPEDAYGADAQLPEEEDWEDQAVELAQDFDIQSFDANEDDQQAGG